MVFLDRLRLFSTSFSSRQALNLETYTVEYIYDNESSLPYLISLSPQNNHVVAQEIEGAIRENRARQVETKKWAISQSDEYISLDHSTFDKLYVWSGNKGKTGTLSSPAQPELLGFENVYANTESPLASTFSKDAIACDKTGNHWSKVITNDAGFPIFEVYYANHTVSSDSAKIESSAGCIYKLGTGLIKNRVYVKSIYDVEYDTGYPRNKFNTTSKEYAFSETTLQVINKTLGTNISPVDGWYKVPSKSKIAIIAETKLPVIQNESDSRVANDASDVPYNNEVLQDKSITWNIDTDLEISRAIDSGDFDDIDSLSKTETIEGLGVKTYTIAR